MTSKGKAEGFNNYVIGLPAKINREIPVVQNSFQEYLKSCRDNSSLFLDPLPYTKLQNLYSHLSYPKQVGLMILPLV